MKKIITIIIILCGLTACHAQQTIDEVIAIVGDEAIMKSDIEGQYMQMQGLTTIDREKAHCMILNQLMEKKLYLIRAMADSLKVNDEQVESELTRRIQYFIQRYGSEENMKEQIGKSALELKNDFRLAIREQLLEQQMQEKIVSDVNVTPSDIKKFYKSLPADSLPYYDTEMEIGQVVVYPKVTHAEKQEAIDKLKKIRKDILSGAITFEYAAIRYSADGSATHGGDLEMQRADQFVPEFSSIALKLKKDSISDIVETKFGYHLIQMLERRGDMIHVRHILIRPEVSDQDRVATRKMLDSIREKIIKDSITFEDAAYKYSKDEETKNRGGLMIDMKTNSSHIPVKSLDGALFFTVDKMKIGEISHPDSYISPEGKEAFRILFLKSKIPPHKANLKDDYPKIMEIAKEYKKLEKEQEWLKKYIPYTYVRIDKSYINCESLKIWIKPGQN